MTCTRLVYLQGKLASFSVFKGAPTGMEVKQQSLDDIWHIVYTLQGCSDGEGTDRARPALGFLPLKVRNTRMLFYLSIVQ